MKNLSAQKDFPTWLKTITILLILFGINTDSIYSESHAKTLAKDVDILWVVLSAALVFFMQAGFLMLETGLSRLKNTINVAVKNLTDYLVATVGFFAIGFGIMWGSSYQGWLGIEHFMLMDLSTGKEYAFFLFQVAFMGTAATIVSGAVAERIKFSAYIYASIFVSLFVYPIFGHWAWGGGWLSRIGFMDFAGSTVVHSLGGWFALAGAILLGPRIGKFSKDGKAEKIPGHELTSSVLGVFILWFGWFGFNGGSTLAFNDLVPLIIVNTCLAASTGGFSSLLISWALQRKPSVESTIDGTLGGLVAITAGCNVLSPISACIIGIIAGATVIFAARILELFHIDDVVNAFPIHGVCGMIGTVAIPLFKGFNLEALKVQAIGVAACAGWSFGLGVLFFLLLKMTIGIRVTRQMEEDGLNFAEHGAGSSWLDLLGSLQELSSGAGDLSRQLRVEKGSEAGAAAELMNRFFTTLAVMVKSIQDKADELRNSSSALNSSWAVVDSKIQNQSANFDEVEAVAEGFRSAFYRIASNADEQQEIESNNTKLIFDLIQEFRLMGTSLTDSKNTSEKAFAVSKQSTNEMEHLATGFARMVESTKKVEEMIQLLSEISDRLGMLSLNASIEAARSGAAGRGFSVVASEVNKLAMLTEEHTKRAGGFFKDILTSVTECRNSFSTLAENFSGLAAEVERSNKVSESILQEGQQIQFRLEDLTSRNESLRKLSLDISESLKNRLAELDSLFVSLSKANDSFSEISTQSRGLTNTSEFLNSLADVLFNLTSRFRLREEKVV
ncbi:chemotaxis protein [Leptospira perolatii]|uniref:Ammonium transporter n=1 Tax=Leptospira perolatii TaxID=2023191 RepID=A0A2M9ZQI2_9LEPT|nr:ammonium transporter [Leptospira perolatii]PJZ70510.1 chemotaxis protein [Leptospira perolatii]PJZ74347.1 chemotaxis protein [Leptospira perolatii]